MEPRNPRSPERSVGYIGTRTLNRSFHKKREIKESGISPTDISGDREKRLDRLADQPARQRQRRAAVTGATGSADATARSRSRSRSHPRS
jgi:hypothetical protein